jgi:hypothetical protein
MPRPQIDDGFDAGAIDFVSGGSILLQNPP